MNLSAFVFKLLCQRLHTELINRRGGVCMSSSHKSCKIDLWLCISAFVVWGWGYVIMSIQDVCSMFHSYCLCLCSSHLCINSFRIWHQFFMWDLLTCRSWASWAEALRRLKLYCRGESHSQRWWGHSLTTLTLLADTQAAIEGNMMIPLIIKVTLYEWTWFCKPQRGCCNLAE